MTAVKYNGLALGGHKNKQKDVNFQNWFQSAYGGGGHSYKFISRSFYRIGNHSFTKRINDKWNEMPDNVINCASVNI